MINKTTAEIRSEIITAILNRLPNLDLTEGTTERDIFVEAPIEGQLSALWSALVYNQKLFAPLAYYADLTTEDIQAYTANYGITPIGATYSTGSVTFYKTTAPTADIVINDGTQVSTAGGNAVTFIVQGTYVMYASIASSYYNATTNRWELTTSVIAQNAGPAYRAGANTITRIINTISGLDGCTNTSPVTGGQAPEEVVSTLRRTVDIFQGRGLASAQGVKNYVASSVSAVNVVSAGDPEMLRDGGLGGAIDIYVIGTTLTTEIDTVTITSTGLDSPLTVNYTSTGIVLINQPVHQIVSVAVNSTILSPSRYELVLDTGLLSKSTRAQDSVELTSTGYFAIGDKVEVTYLYNSRLKTIEDTLNNTENHFVNRDYLLREETQVLINIYMQIKETSGQDFTTVQSTVETTISAYINSILNAGSLEKADIVGIVKNISSVDNLNLNTVSMTPVGGGTVTAQGDILFGKNEYPSSNTLTIVQWTS